MNCSAAIWDCNTRYEHKHPQSDKGAQWCADENSGSCNGPGRVYYGAALTWTYKDISSGNSVYCSNGDFGCDPLFAFKKQCWS